MKNKFNIGDIVISTDPHAIGTIIFVIRQILTTESGYAYRHDFVNEWIHEDYISLYVEPKKKVKKYLWVYSEGLGEHTATRGFYKDEQEVKKNVKHVTWFQRLDWSMIEVEE